MTKKLIGMLLCVSMTAVLIMGCGSGSTGETGEKEDGTETEEKKRLLSWETEVFIRSFTRMIMAS